MKTNYFSKLLVAAMLLVSFSSFAQEVRWTPDYPGLGFAIENNEASLNQIASEATFENQTLNIPASVSFDGVDYPVTSIVSHAIAWKVDGINKVVIPGSVKTISDNTFTASTGIKEIELGEGVESIGVKAFESCSSLETINFPSSIQTIGESAFIDCASLKEAKLNEGLATIGTSVFIRCKAMEKVFIPESLANVASWVFMDCVSLKEIHLAHKTAPTIDNIWSNFKCESNTDNINLLRDQVTVYIPTGSTASYEPTVWQSYFTTELVEEGSSSVPSNVASAVRAYSADGQLVVEGANAGSKLNVFSTIGQQIYSSAINDNHFTVSLPTGLYIVKVDNNIFKVMCK